MISAVICVLFRWIWHLYKLIICHVLVYCFGSFLLQDLFFSLQVFAFKGQNMTLNVLLTRILYCGAGPGCDLWKHGGAISHLRATRRADYLRNWVLFFKVKGHIGSEYFSQHWQRLSPSLRRSKNVFGCYRSSLKSPNCVLKQQTHNLQLSDAVASFGFLPLREAGFFGVVWFI